ncbi:hypothetical protein J8281_03570 [Aquimarina sp. U1-2]|uniref:hypothetical protein n=1 Tax=Aquimarina sp. U1-2 TaxID=2823141 RepID=UPI001AECD23B|nr:hypothetical protein [Aquimarina sp. U1-2]MBP2831257.1 hypothetical protein [Aquimarina sp. U1-2]
MNESFRHRKPGSVRLTDEQYAEMESLGIDNESAYVKYKLNGAKNHLMVLRNQSGIDETLEDKEMAENQDTSLGVPTDKPASANALADKLSIQRLSLENQQLREKLDSLSMDKQQTLDGVHHQVNNLLKDELLKRDFESLKKENTNQLKQIEKLEKQLEKSEASTEEKQHEIEELVKKLSLVELGKVLIPGAINGLAKRYPKEMHGLASTLGGLNGEEDNILPPSGLSEEQQNLLGILEYFRELFTESQFDQIVQLIAQMGEQIKDDQEILQKVSYYLRQLNRVQKSRQNTQPKETQPETENTTE